MTSPQKRRGDRAELEVQAWLRDHLGVPARRALGAGRKDDCGDITGVPNTVIQVVDWKDVRAAVKSKPIQCELQRIRTGSYMPDYSATETNGLHPIVATVEPATFAATFVRLRGGDYRVVLTPEQWATYWREAQ